MSYGLAIQTQDGLRDISEVSIMKEYIRLPWGEPDGSQTYVLPAQLRQTNCIPLGISYDGKYPPVAVIIGDTLYYGPAGSLYTNDPTQNGAVVVLQLMGLSAQSVSTF